MNVDTFTDPYSQIALSQHHVRLFFFFCSSSYSELRRVDWRGAGLIRRVKPGVVGANVPRTDAARHRRPHGSIQKEDFAEFGVNYMGATKWFHIMQKKNPFSSKINTVCTHSELRALPSSQIWGSRSRDCVREQRKPSHSEGRPSLSRTNRSLRREMDGNWQQTTELSPQTKLFGEIWRASVQIEISTIRNKRRQAASELHFNPHKCVTVGVINCV